MLAHPPLTPLRIDAHAGNDKIVLPGGLVLDNGAKRAPWLVSGILMGAVIPCACCARDAQPCSLVACLSVRVVARRLLQTR